MAKNTSIILGEHFETFISEQVQDGRYGNASEVIRDALRLLEREQAKFLKLKQELQKGLDSGPGEPFDPDEFLKEMNAEYAKKI